MRFIRSSPLSPLFFFSLSLCFALLALLSLSLSLKSTKLRRFRQWVTVGGGPDLGFGGLDKGSQWVGDPIWVLGVSAVGGGGWKTRSRFWGLRRCGYQVGVDGYRLLPRFGYGCQERVERDKWFFFLLFKKIIKLF